MMRFGKAALVLVGAFVVASPAHARGVRRYTTREGVVVLTNRGTDGGAARSRRSRPVIASNPPRPSSSFAPTAATSDYQKARAAARTEYELYLAEACELYNVPVALARAVVAAESNFNQFAISNKGAMGLMQLMPATAAELYVDDAFDPRQNIHGGVRYLRILANQFGGDISKIVAAYNAGPEAVRRAGGVPNYAETQEYVRRVIQYYYVYRDAAS